MGLRARKVNRGLWSQCVSALTLLGKILGLGLKHAITQNLKPVGDPGRAPLHGFGNPLPHCPDGLAARDHLLRVM